MNVDLLIDWGCKILTFFDKQIDSQTLFKPKEVEAKLGWILTYRESLAEWQVLVELVTTTESFVRTEGILYGGQKKLSNILTKQIRSQRVSWLRRELLKFVAQEASKCKPNERLVGSSEVLESVFGKLKYLSRWKKIKLAVVLRLLYYVLLRYFLRPQIKP